MCFETSLQLPSAILRAPVLALSRGVYFWGRPYPTKSSSPPQPPTRSYFLHALKTRRRASDDLVSTMLTSVWHLSARAVSKSGCPGWVSDATAAECTPFPGFWNREDARGEWRGMNEAWPRHMYIRRKQVLSGIRWGVVVVYICSVSSISEISWSHKNLYQTHSLSRTALRLISITKPTRPICPLLYHFDATQIKKSFKSQTKCKSLGPHYWLRPFCSSALSPSQLRHQCLVAT